MLHLPTHDYLDKLNIPYAKADFPTNIEKGAASVARALGYRERQMIKTLIFETDTGECLLVMVGGDQTIVSGNLKKVAGSRNIKMASFETVRKKNRLHSWVHPTFFLAARKLSILFR